MGARGRTDAALQPDEESPDIGAVGPGDASADAAHLSLSPISAHA